MAYRSSGTEANSKFFVIDFRAKFFLPFFETNPTDCLSLVSEYSEEEEEEAMAETMEQYMSKTRTDYGSGVARPKIDNKDQFELKGQFLKELRENTFSGSDNEDANEHIEKVLKIVDLFHVPNITVDQLMLRVFPISLTGAASHWLRNEPTGSIKTWEDLKTKFLNKYCPPGRTAKKMEEINNFQQEPDETLFQAWERFKELLMKCPQHYLTKMQMELDLKARLMRETLELNRSLNSFLEDYIELNDLNEPFELRRNQGDDLMPTIEEGEVIEEFRTRYKDLDTGIDDYPSYCDNDKKIHIDCAHNLKFSCMIGFEFTHVNFFPLLYVNVMSKKFHNSIMKDKMVYKGDNVVGALMNVPIFVGTFSVVTDFAVLEDMDAYRDEGMGDVIVGEPFLKEVRIKARRFDGMITIYNGDDEVTYQMVRSHPRFKHHTNEQCNKIPPLLKDPTLSEFCQWKNGSHAVTLACMRWNNKREAEDKSNLKTLL
ncbi:homeodomain-like protein [Tanacetum coccineum]